MVNTPNKAINSTAGETLKVIAEILSATIHPNTVVSKGGGNISFVHCTYTHSGCYYKILIDSLFNEF